MTTDEKLLISALKNKIADWKMEELASCQLAKERPEYHDYFLAQETGIMRCRVDLEVLLQKRGVNLPTTVESFCVPPEKVERIKG